MTPPPGFNKSNWGVAGVWGRSVLGAPRPQGGWGFEPVCVYVAAGPKGPVVTASEARAVNPNGPKA